MTVVNSARILDSNGRREFFPCLESLRSLCAIVVAIFHITWTSHIGTIPFMDRAWTFVDFFFVLSGFVISNAYAGRISNLNQAMRFFIKRLFRLYPLHLMTLSAVAIVQYVGWKFVGTGDPFGDNWKYLTFLNLTLSHAIGLSVGAIYNVPSWSVSVEFYAYMVFALICLLFIRKLWITRAIVVIGAAALVILAFDPNGQFLFTPSNSSWARGLFGFSVGCLACAVHQVGKLRLSGLMGDIFVAALFAVILFVMSTNSDRSAVLLLLPFLHAVFIVALVNTRESRIRDFLELSWCRQFGKISYSIYMNHVFLLMLFSFAMSRLFLGDEVSTTHGILHSVPYFWGDLGIVLYIITLIVSAGLTYYFIENPGRVLGQRIADSFGNPELLRSKQS